ncbi:peptidoglycan glycosyltransferase FtsW [Leifsonia shinshuensis]|uniref:Probable peptidoglycan glycosyltransferase FtsW n=1 Tax=Leifsonia shinshuensis TaxID=150026 RepID=A0A853CWE6_9MICO|nr:putative peptidoglycan glycosyltransferase FtsW [Leifsonia shinshuensis]NYJ23504.1 UDP-N-acetylglucosamine--N-acetylmuramyl-(pentapeptide) pyrophosphoryl-undecaprenol N-acetylglucosamine transferase/cell division protein FtsW [Leifsonia shinshuensis]
MTAPSLDSPAPAGPAADTSADASSGRPGRRILVRLPAAFRPPSRHGAMLVAVVVFLVVFGLLMVLSSSSIESHSDGNGFFGRFWSQWIFCGVGLAALLLVPLLSRRVIQRAAVVLLLAACVLQLLAITTPLGVQIGDNTNWIRLGPITGQPSEGIKLGLAVWLGTALGARGVDPSNGRTLAMRTLPVVVPALLLVQLGGDLGTTVVMAAFTLGACYFAGARLRYLGLALGVVAVAALLLALSSETRRGRVFAFFGGTSSVNPDVDWQVKNAHYALASGRLFGVGLGNSHAKWSWLPSADTDFIFAVIGEELGLIGAALVLGLFALLGLILIAIVRAAADPVVRITTGTVLVWLVFQAFVNIAVVLGLLPVLGVPLPFISAGGTAMVASLAATGVVLSFTRQERPERAVRGPRAPVGA